MMTILLLFLLATKHFICDFPLQSFPYQYKNKGIYGHLGGILHSGIHALGTFLIVLIFTDPLVSLGLALFDGIVHYHIDYFKMRINTIKQWTATNSENFWILLGIDQYLHTVTYIVIAVILI